MSLPDITPDAVSDHTPLAALTTMRVGGPAERVYVAHDTDELVRLATELWDEGDDWLLLGGGSNTVVHDDGYPGALLLVRNTGTSVIADPTLPLGTLRLRVQAGHDWDHLVASCVERGWSGIEALSGIPGLAGAAPVQNIGAYGQELSDVLHSIEYLDRDQHVVSRIPASELELGYRDSAIKQDRDGIVLSIDLLLTDTALIARALDPAAADAPGAAPVALSAPVQYGQLAAALGVEIGDRVPIAELRLQVLRLRAAKGMVLDAADQDSWSAGSFFTNPIVSEQFARSLPESAPKFPVGADAAGQEAQPAITMFSELAAGLPLRVPTASPARSVKLSAAWLIEQAGVQRGFRLPGSGAAISSKHTLAITNRGNATAAEVAELARFVVQRVQQEFGVILVPEPNLYGLEV